MLGRTPIAMWIALFILTLFALVACHLWWRKRFGILESQVGRLKRTIADEEEKHQQVLSREHLRQAALFNSMLEGVLVLDGDGRVQMINESLRSLFRLTAAIDGRMLMEAFRLPELAELFRRLLHEGTVMGFELELPGLDQRSLQVNAAALKDRKGRATGAILVFHDLTRLKQLENTRREFVANVSHELRTPLSMIKGFVETLLDGAKDDPQIAARFLRTIEKHADRLTYLIEDLLTISRLESGQVVMNLQPTDIAEVAERVCEDLTGRAADRKVRISLNVSKPLKAYADGARLQQVFFNLIDNAIKYGRSPGEVKVDGGLNNGLVEIKITDDGPGIPPEACSRIFERFYRVDKARSREQGGTGLGLAIVKHIVQAHHGEVWVESSMDRGASFHFNLPAVESGDRQTGKADLESH